MAIPIITVAQMREWEQASWAAGRKQVEVIRRVGHALAERALQMLKPGESVVVLAGKGNNGEDARQTVRHFIHHECHLLEAIHPQACGKAFQELLALRPALIIDGVFGVGLNRPLDADWIALFESINQTQIPILSVDVPSGLNADTGEPAGAALRAAVTLTVGAPKWGLLAASAWPYVGRLEVAPDVGLVDGPHTGEMLWTMPEDFRQFPPRRPAHGHKGSFGHLAIIAGSLGYHGAAVLAARGAQRAQPGLISLFTQAQTYLPVASQLQSVMVHLWPEELFLPDSCSAVLVGPGLAASGLPENLVTTTGLLWEESPLPVIVDASALDWLPRGRVESGALRLITPHPGEAARLLETTVEHVQADRPGVVRELSRQYGDCWVVLKGHQTVFGRATGELFVNSSGNPQLAQGGAGDWLAGFLGGLLAQPALQAEPSRAIRYGIWRHGTLADELECMRPGWTIEDLAAF